MPIKNKDGTLFKLQGINPLMKEQDHWEGNEDWKIHHVEAEEVVIQDPKRMTPEGLPEDAPLPAIVGVGVIPQTELLYCLPLVVHEEEDPLYGQKKLISAWGEKFNFEAIRIDYTGLTATFFARVPQDKVTRGSIILVFRERQWWKVNGTEQSKDGINIYCIPSELKPSMI